MNITRNSTIKTFLILSLSTIATGFANTILSTQYKLISRMPTIAHRTTALQMCNINATDIFEKIKGLRGTRSDFIRVGSTTTALLMYANLATAEEIPDDSWTVHNGVFTKDEIKDFTKTSSGLLYKDVVTGKGQSPNDGDSVTLQMVGYIYETGEKWINTYNGVPAYQSIIRAGPHPNQRFMKGLNEGVMDMKKGGKRILVIPAYLAYNYIPVYSQENPGATLVCYIEMMSFTQLKN
jgi:hypothetical protein